MKTIQPLLDENATIPTDAFCTHPPAEASIDIPDDELVSGKQYPIPFAPQTAGKRACNPPPPPDWWHFLPDADSLAAERPSMKAASSPDSSDKILDNILDYDNANFDKPSANVAALDLHYSFEHRKLRPVRQLA